MSEDSKRSIIDMMNQPSSMNTVSIIDAPSSKATTHATITTTAAVKDDDNTVEKTIFPSMPSALVGSIIGTRSESGTMVELKGTGSFDVFQNTSVDSLDNDHFGRLRAQTAPSILTTEPATTTTATTMSSSSTTTTPTTTAGTNDIDIVPTSATTGSTNTSVNQTTSYVDFDDDDDGVVDDTDEELKMAMAMALAIQSNPHLTPREIHELLGTTSQQLQIPQQQLLSSGGTKPSTTTASSLLSSFTTTSSTTTTAKPSRFTQMFGNFTAAPLPLHPPTSTAHDDTTTIGITSADSKTPTATAATKTATITTYSTPILPSIEEKFVQEEMIRTTNMTTTIATGPSSIVAPPTTMAVASTATVPPPPQQPSLTVVTRDVTATTTTTVPIDEPTIVETLNIVVSDATPTASNRGKKGMAENSILNSSSSSNHSSVAVAISTTPTVTNTTTTPIHHPTISPSFTKQISQRSAMLFKSASLRNSSSSNQQQQQQQPVRISGIAWKRRGGMGKYSTSHAWERRRIELVGTKLLYYIIDEENENDTDDVDPSGGVESSTVAGSTSFRKGTWLENSGINFTSSISLASGMGESVGGTNKEPRGFLDLAKEKATVHAAFGHSGAPTPFALSIKVRAETKWKLCFDRHAIEMDWLAAISDVVIQCSVDAYNGYLLEAADPANHSDFTLFHPPMIKDGPAVTKSVTATTTTTPTAIMGSSTQHRLWMLEDYHVTNSIVSKDMANDETLLTLPYSANNSTLSSKSNAQDSSSRATDNELRIEDSSDIGRDHVSTKEKTSSEVVSTTAFETTIATVISHDMIQDTILDESNQRWVIPQERLLHILLIANLAMLYTRASSTTISGFWSILVVANFGFLVCFVKEPTWQCLVNLIKTAPTTTSRKATASAAMTVASRCVAVPELTTTIYDTSIIQSKDDLLLSITGVECSVVATSGYVPLAGCTTVHLKDPSDVPKNANGEMFAGWCTVPGEILAIRSHGYAITKKKVPSPGELYECIHLEVFESPQRYPDMAKRVQLPKVEFDDDVHLKTWRCPDLFIISIALPTDAPRMGKTSSDGGGYTITMYYRMKQETRDILRRVTADGYDPSSEMVPEEEIQTNKVNAVRLLEEWVRRAPTDHKFQSRFKIVPNAHNLKEIGMPSWISKYNGKPFLIKRPGVTGFLFAHPEVSCVEFDVSLHPFPYLAKQAICFMKESYFKKVLVSFGFVIEGRADDELPECLIGLVQLCYPDPQFAIQASDFFNGTAQRSF